jgi:hypothetical protein
MTVAAASGGREGTGTSDTTDTTAQGLVSEMIDLIACSRRVRPFTSEVHKVRNPFVSLFFLAQTTYALRILHLIPVGPFCSLAYCRFQGLG